MALFVAFSIVWCGPAFAYIHPNSSGLVFQIFAPLATLFMAGVFFVRDRLERVCRAAFRWAKKLSTIRE
jgi:hypothetical protein